MICKPTEDFDEMDATYQFIFDTISLPSEAKPTEDNASKSNQNQDDSAQYHNHRHHYDENNLTNHRPVTKYDKDNLLIISYGPQIMMSIISLFADGSQIIMKIISLFADGSQIMMRIIFIICRLATRPSSEQQPEVILTLPDFLSPRGRALIIRMNW